MRPHSFPNYDAAKSYYKQLYNAKQFQKKLTPKTSSGEVESTKKGKGKRKRDHDSGSEGHKPKCDHCGKPHASKDCWTLPSNKNKRPKNYWTSHKEMFNVTFTQEQVNAMMSAMQSKRVREEKPKKKRKVQSEDSDFDTNFLSKLDIDSEPSDVSDSENSN